MGQRLQHLKLKIQHLRQMHQLVKLGKERGRRQLKQHRSPQLSRQRERRSLQKPLLRGQVNPSRLTVKLLLRSHKHHLQKDRLRRMLRRKPSHPYLRVTPLWKVRLRSRLCW
ncbi:uncharacterized protein LOC144921743 [Branchiostoma floridae x Branchiostoma belcheri]